MAMKTKERYLRRRVRDLELQIAILEMDNYQALHWIGGLQQLVKELSQIVTRGGRRG